MTSTALVKTTDLLGGGTIDIVGSWAEDYRSALKKQGTPVWYLMAKDERHGYQKKPNQDFQFYASVMFPEKYLLKRRWSLPPINLRPLRCGRAHEAGTTPVCN